MAKKLTTKELIEQINRRGIITEKEILLLCHHYDDSEDFGTMELLKTPLPITDEQAIKGLNFLRKSQLTSKNKLRKNHYWTANELKAIGFNGEGQPLTELDPHNLFFFDGFENIGRGFGNKWSPRYLVGGIYYYMNFGVPIICKETLEHEL